MVNRNRMQRMAMKSKEVQPSLNITQKTYNKTHTNVRSR